MHFEKTMCDRLGHKYKDLFGHLEFILNKMNMVLNTHGNGLSDEELKMLNELFFKLETGQIEIIEFTRPIEKYFDVDEIYKENQQLKRNCNIGNENLNFYIKENQQLKDKLKYWVDIHMDLKKWLEEEYKNCDKIGNPSIGYAMGQIKRTQSKIQELEKEN